MLLQRNRTVICSRRICVYLVSFPSYSQMLVDNTEIFIFQESWLQPITYNKLWCEAQQTPPPAAS